MKRLTMKAAMLLMAMALTLGAGMTACSSDDDESGTEAVGENEAELAQAREQWQAEALYEQLCMTDTTKTPAVPVASIGKVLYTVTPTVYYTIANSVEEARERYVSLVAVASNDSVVTTMPDDVRRGDVHVSFAASTRDGEVAHITVDCPRLKDVVTSIVFLTQEAWPENDTASPFNFLSLWQYVPNGNYYLTVRDSNGGMGLMLTFDSGWTKQVVHSGSDGEFWMYRDLASSACFQDLSTGMRFYPDKFQKMMEAFAQNGGSDSKTYKVLYRLFYNKEAINKRRFIYKWHFKFPDVDASFATFENRAIKWESVEKTHFIQFSITWNPQLSHNAWFYSDFVPSETDFKCIYK